MRNQVKVEFQPQKALAYTKAIAQPRLVGTEGEIAVADQLESQLEGFGYAVERQSFRYILGRDRFFLLSHILRCLWILGLLVFINLSQMVLLIPFSVFYLLDRYLYSNSPQIKSQFLLSKEDDKVCERSTWESLLGPKIQSSNLIATHPEHHEDEQKPHLYLLAHYDTKSQIIPIPIRLALHRVFTYGMKSVLFISILSFFLPGLLPFINVVGLVTLLAGLPQFFQGVGNQSMGAFDNASGVGLVLHLAEILSTQMDLLGKLKVTILLTSAEEHGLSSSRASVRDHLPILQDEMSNGGCYVINFDGVGVDEKLLLESYQSQLPLSEDGQFAHLIERTSDGMGKALGKFPRIGASMDHMPFAQEGIHAVSLGMLEESLKVVHTPRDTIEKLSAKGFKHAGELTLRVIKKLAYGMN